MAKFTKLAIQKTFIKLLNERPLNQITVRTIVEECGINRNSFYYHFRDISELATELIESTTDEVLEKHKSIDSIEGIVMEFIEFATKYKKAFQNVYNSMNREVFEQDLLMTCDRFVRKYFEKRTDKMNMSEENLEILVLLYRSEFFGVFSEWLMRGMDDEYASRIKSIFDQKMITEEKVLTLLIK
ncbi:MAG: TetR/AcrR family transcriptional regulator [Treponema sp.]|nr:TetR/AcrR family transcriptional regulator [Treponema sp.]